MQQRRAGRGQRDIWKIKICKVTVGASCCGIVGLRRFFFSEEVSYDASSYVGPPFPNPPRPGHADTFKSTHRADPRFLVHGVLVRVADAKIFPSVIRRLPVQVIHPYAAVRDIEQPPMQFHALKPAFRCLYVSGNVAVRRTYRPAKFRYALDVFVRYDKTSS